MAGLEALIGRVAGTPLDRTRPLWEMHVCQPFDDGRIAVITKMHHALADGVAANALLGNIVDGLGGDPRPARAPAASARSTLEPTPTWFDQLRMALVDAVLQIGQLPGLLSRTVKAVAAVLRHRRASSVQVPRPLLDVPRTPFNGALTARRNFATAQLPIEEIKEVQRAHGVTMNDVVLAVVGGALRRWLAGRRASCPARSLVAGVPVATDAPGAGPRLGGNRVSNIFTSLATDIDDPHERLAAISRTTGESKLIHQTLGANMLVDWVQFAPPAPLTAAMRLYSRSRAASYHPPPFNVVVSNVRGPAAPVSISGAHLPRPLQRRSDPRGHRAQRHGVVLRGPDELLLPRLSRPGRRPGAPGGRASPRARRAAHDEGCSCMNKPDRTIRRPDRARPRGLGAADGRRGRRPQGDAATGGRPAARGPDAGAAGPRAHLRHRRRRARRRTRRPWCCCTPSAAPPTSPGRPRSTELSRTHRVIAFDQRWHGRGIRSPRFTVRRLRRRRRGRDGRARRRAGDHRRLLDGRRDRPARLAPAPVPGWSGWCCARPLATSAG